MWDDFADLMDSAVEWLRHGWLRFLGSVLAIIALLVGLGLVDVQAAQVVGGLLGFFIVILVITYFGLSLRSAKARLGERERILNRYTAHFRNATGNPDFTIEDWEENTVVSKNGDSTIERWITIRATRDLISCWSANFQADVLNPRQQKKVRVQARDFNPAAKVPGVRYDCTTEWDVTQVSKQWVNVHFHAPALAGTTQRILLRWTWPGMYRKLLIGETDEVEWIARRSFGRIKSTITFDKTCKLKNSFSCAPHPGSPNPIQIPQPDGSIKLEWEHHNITENSTVGYKLDPT